MTRVMDVLKIAKSLGKRQRELLRACAAGDNLLGCGYTTHRRQRPSLAAKGVIEIAVVPGIGSGYVVTEFGQEVLSAL